MTTSMIYIPEELCLHILVRLPVTSLLRFRSVCKLWNQIISSKSFCTIQLAHKKSSSDTKKYVLFDHDDFYTANLIDTVSCIDVKSSSSHCYKPKLFETEREEIGSIAVEVYGICDGLICLSDQKLRLKSSIYIWNPFAKRGRKLPCVDDSLDMASVAFGYYADDYKVIRVVRYYVGFDVYIYSFRSDQWELSLYEAPDNIAELKYYRNCMQYPNAMLVKDLACFVNREARQLVCFNIAHNNIQVIDFPEYVYGESSFIMKAYDGESICFLDFECRMEGDYSDVVMYILNRDKSMWESIYIVRMDCCSPLGFIDDGEVMVQMYGSKEFMLFNLETNELKELKFQEKPENAWKIDSIADSLVLLDERTANEYIIKDRQNCSSTTAAFTLNKWKT